MSYKSPLHIIKGLASEPDFKLTDIYLIRLRKQLFAELNLSGDTTITVNKKQYSKDEIIKTIDVLLSNPDLELHEFIFNQPFLLNYLEDESLQLNTNQYCTLTPKHLKAKLENIIYPRLLVQFKKGLSTRSYSQAEGAAVIMITLSEHYKNECFEVVHQSLYTFSNFLYEIETNIDDYKKDDLKFLTYPSLAILLNSLPEEFNEVKNDIVIRIINLVVAYHKLTNHSKEITKGISNVLIKINCEEEHSKLIRSNHKALTNTLGSLRGDGGDTMNWIRGIGFGIFLLINVLRMCNKSDSSSNHAINNNIYSSLNSYNNLNSTTLNVEEQIKNLRNTIGDSFKLNHTNFSSNYDTMLLKNGDNPFRNQLFYVKDSTFKTWKHALNIVNKVNYDVIVMYYDSSKTNFISTYIKSGEKYQLTIADKINLVFYFGNTLMASTNINTNNKLLISASINLMPEYFKNTNSQNIDLFYKTFRLDLKNKLTKKIKPTIVTLELDSAFIADSKDEREYKKFTLKDIDFIIK